MQPGKSKAKPRTQPSGELTLLATIRARAAALPHNRISLGIGDDCALIRPRRGEEIAITTDLSIEGRHFNLAWHPPESIGHRTLARGLSDLAAMGARPAAAFLSLGLPRSLTPTSAQHPDWVTRFLDGLLALAAHHKLPLAGGDLAESPIALADIILTGTLPIGQALRRSQACPGDHIYVTGALGGAAAELAALANSPISYANHTVATHTNPHLYPQPRIAQGLYLRKQRLATAAMDLSDGLSTDLTHLCQASGVAAEIHAQAIPLGPKATLAMALHGGEDYELLFTAPAKSKLPRTIAGLQITAIGQIVKSKPNRPQITIQTEKGSQPLTPQGWEHFT